MMKLNYSIAILAFILLLSAGPVLAQSEIGSTDPEDLKNEIERLMIFYTDDHPDVQILRERLRRLEAQKEISRKLEKGQLSPDEVDQAMQERLTEKPKNYRVIPKQTLPGPGQ